MLALARIIDANANRAREALRVLEDIARFALDESALTSELKTIRHDLRGAIESLAIDRGVLLAARDTEGDVGTAIHTEAEARREGLPAIAAAAAGRLSESLRSLAEAAKALGRAGAAEQFEQARYRGYTLEQRLILALGGPRRQWRLCVLITESLCAQAWDRTAQTALEGGADCLQLREKTLEGAELLRRARWLRDLTRERRAALVINDRPDIAILARADAVHLGQQDLPVHEARAIAGLSLAIGVSTTNLDQARRAAAEGADYCGLGPMFPTTTKHKPEIAGPAYFRAYLADPVAARLPHLAIGGITPANAGLLAAEGCRGIAVSSAVCGAADPAAACRALLAALETRPAVSPTGRA